MWNAILFVICMIFFGFNLYPACECLFSGDIVPGVIVLLLFGKIHPDVTGQKK